MTTETTTTIIAGDDETYGVLTTAEALERVWEVIMGWRRDQWATPEVQAFNPMVNDADLLRMIEKIRAANDGDSLMASDIEGGVAIRSARHVLELRGGDAQLAAFCMAVGLTGCDARDLNEWLESIGSPARVTLRRTKARK